MFLSQGEWIRYPLRPRRTSSTRTGLLIGVSLLCFSVIVAAAPPARATVALGGYQAVTFSGGRSIGIDNLTNYPNSRVDWLAKMADAGTVSTCPNPNTTVGQMHSGDRVIVTVDGMYWLDVEDRSGGLAGMWGIAPDPTGNLNFKHIVGGCNWGPNFLLPGSSGYTEGTNNVGGYVWRADGFTVVLTPHGGTDGATTDGHGTFTLDNTNNGTISYTGVQANGAGYDHIYQFSGVLRQEFANPPTTVAADTAGHVSQFRYTLTYRFRDQNVNTTSYTSCSTPSCGDNNQRIRVELTINPTNLIDVDYLIMTSSTAHIDTVDTGYTWDNGSGTRERFGSCNAGQVFNPAVPGNLITNCSGQNFIQQPSYSSLPAGAWDTARQSQNGSSSEKEITYLEPGWPFSAAVARASIFNRGLGVYAFDDDLYINSSPSTSVGLTMQANTNYMYAVDLMPRWY